MSEAAVNETTASTGLARLADTTLGDEVEFVAARARSIGTALANEALAPLGLKVRSYSVLSLACSGAAPSQRELAEFLILDASQIVGLVDDLENAGYVVRTPDYALT
ncbi:MarR family winged helix-turn-helix transcriptional regulator, partial [Rhizobium johnstonii]|uniref:MarR family winged helix-turn-helix transcriptional regulator n=1 Tax=Rhizobium johnstonii TaxID=3019933 RepID=UPI003F9A29B2